MRLHSHRLFSASATVGVLVVCGIAVSSSDAHRVGDNPCVEVQTDPTIANCWECFQKQLDECDERQTPASQEACYEGANTFYEWCFGQTTGDGDDDPGQRAISQARERNDLLTSNKNVDVRATLSFDLHLPMVSDPDSIAVELRIRQADGVVRIPVATTAHPVDTRGLHTIVVGTGDLELSSTDSIGIVTTVRNRDDQVRYAYAFVAPVTDSFDLNQDGVFDVRDQVLAVEKFTSGELDMKTMNRILEAAP